MKLVSVAAVLALAVATAHAADTPGSNPSVAAPTAAERLASARKAIERVVAAHEPAASSDRSSGVAASLQRLVMRSFQGVPVTAATH